MLRILRLQLRPEPIDFAFGSVRRAKNVVKSEVTPGRNQLRPELEIPLHAGVAVITVDEKKVDRSARQEFPRAIARFDRVTVLSKQNDLDPGAICGELLKELLLGLGITASARAAEHVDGNDELGRDATPGKQRSAFGGANFQDHARLLLRDEFHQSAIFGFHLPRRQDAKPSFAAVNASQVPQFFRTHIFWQQSPKFRERSFEMTRREKIPDRTPDARSEFDQKQVQEVALSKLVDCSWKLGARS